MLRRPSGTEIFARIASEFRNEIFPKPGDVVSFSFRNFSNKGIPADPKIFRIRKDISWETVVGEYYKEMSKSLSANGLVFTIVIVVNLRWSNFSYHEKLVIESTRTTALRWILDAKEGKKYETIFRQICGKT